MALGAGNPQQMLTEAEIAGIVAEGLAALKLVGKRVLFIIPDATRSGPIPLFFRLFHENLSGKVRALDYLIALGTHIPMPEEAINKLVGISAEERAGRYRDVRIFNHAWQDPDTLRKVGHISADEIATITNGLLKQGVDVTINKLLFDYDQVIICGPVFPHEVVGFSGGNKYFFPGISGPDVINLTHWIGALITCYEIIGTKHTPVREVINRAAGLVDVPKACCTFVVKGKDEVYGTFFGSPEDAWAAAADVAAQTHVKYVEKPYQTILAIMPEMYDDLWTAAKGMYKLEPVCADGGEVIIYAPHIDEVSYTHGKVIDRIGYHVRDYFVKQWERFKDEPWGVLAHSTHVKGMGRYADGVETPRVQVSLATRIPPERCARINLGYRDPDTVGPAAFKNREAEGVLCVPKAGELLYRLKS
jgi:nickel-dependent lactate racemase